VRLRTLLSLREARAPRRAPAAPRLRRLRALVRARHPEAALSFLSVRLLASGHTKPIFCFRAGRRQARAARASLPPAAQSRAPPQCAHGARRGRSRGATAGRRHKTNSDPNPRTTLSSSPLPHASPCRYSALTPLRCVHPRAAAPQAPCRPPRRLQRQQQQRHRKRHPRATTRKRGGRSSCAPCRHASLRSAPSRRWRRRCGPGWTRRAASSATRARAACARSPPRCVRLRARAEASVRLSVRASVRACVEPDARRPRTPGGARVGQRAAPRRALPGTPLPPNARPPAHTPQR
jgi:hypothetical protein